MGTPTELARQLAALRKEKRRQAVCPICGAVFEAIPGQKYCSRRCLNRASYRAWYRRHKAKARSGALGAG